MSLEEIPSVHFMMSWGYVLARKLDFGGLGHVEMEYTQEKITKQPLDFLPKFDIIYPLAF